MNGHESHNTMSIIRIDKKKIKKYCDDHNDNESLKMLFLLERTHALTVQSEIYFFPEDRVDNVSEETMEETKLKLYTARSRIKVTATSYDNHVKYKCEARHEALPEPLSTDVEIRVLCEFP